MCLDNLLFLFSILFCLFFCFLFHSSFGFLLEPDLSILVYFIYNILFNYTLLNFIPVYANLIHLSLLSSFVFYCSFLILFLCPFLLLSVIVTFVVLFYFTLNFYSFILFCFIYLSILFVLYYFYAFLCYSICCTFFYI